MHSRGHSLPVGAVTLLLPLLKVISLCGDSMASFIRCKTCLSAFSFEPNLTVISESVANAVLSKMM